MDAVRKFLPVAVLVILMIVLPVTAAETRTTLAERTTNLTGSWQGREEAIIPFKITDFTGFKTVEISYRIHEETGQVHGACGLVFLVTTDEYLLATSRGSPLIYARPNNQLLYGEGTAYFDPRTPGDPGWMTGNYRLLGYFQPANCVNEATVRIDLVREGDLSATGGTETTPHTTIPSTTPAGATTGTTAAVTMGTRTVVPTAPTAAGPSPARTRTPLDTAVPALALIAGTVILLRRHA
jgi:hypothetical protein